MADARLELAKKLREEADGSSEAALRNKLSRSYYSIFHAAHALLGRYVDHPNLARELSKLDVGLADDVRNMARLRSSADYDVTYVQKNFSSLEAFRLEVRDQVQKGLEIFTDIVSRIEAKHNGDKEQ